MARKKTKARLKRDAEKRTFLAIKKIIAPMMEYDRLRLTDPRQWPNHTANGLVSNDIAGLKLGFSRSSAFDNGRTFSDSKFSNSRHKTTGKKLAKAHKVGKVVRHENGFTIVYDNDRSKPENIKPLLKKHGKRVTSTDTGTDARAMPTMARAFINRK